MDVTSAYLSSNKNLPDFMGAIQKAAVPQRFTHGFLEVLGFKSTNDRAFIPMLKGLGFIDQNSVPTQAYKEFRNVSTAKRILARQIELAYPGLFTADETAQNLPDDSLKGKLTTLSGKDAAVVQKMASTFKALCSLADFANAATVADIKAEDEQQTVDSPAMNLGTPPPSSLRFSHTIYINLPATTEIAVYDAIFKSLRENLT